MSSSAPPSRRLPRILSTNHTRAALFTCLENWTTMYVGGKMAAVSPAESFGLADMSPSDWRCV